MSGGTQEKAVCRRFWPKDLPHSGKFSQENIYAKFADVLRFAKSFSHGHFAKPHCLVSMVALMLTSAAVNEVVRKMIDNDMGPVEKETLVLSIR